MSYKDIRVAKERSNVARREFVIKRVLVVTGELGDVVRPPPGVLPQTNLTGEGKIYTTVPPA